MFFNQYDTITALDQQYLVIAVENQTLIVYNPATLEVKEIDKALCTRVKTMADVRNAAIYAASLGTIERIKSKAKLMDTLKNYKWTEGADLKNRGTAWLYEVIAKMDEANSFDENIVDTFFEKVKALTKSSNRTSIVLSGNYQGAHICIKLTVVFINGQLGVTHVKRIFGDDGVFGNIKRSSDTGKRTTTHGHSISVVHRNNKSCLAS